MKYENFEKLTASEQLEVKKAMQHPKIREVINNPEIAADKIEGRKASIQNSLALELLYLRAENEQRAASGEAPISPEDRELVVNDKGIVKSKYRAKNDIKAAMDEQQSRIERFNEDVRSMGR